MSSSLSCGIQLCGHSLFLKSRVLLCRTPAPTAEELKALDEAQAFSEAAEKELEAKKEKFEFQAVS